MNEILHRTHKQENIELLKQRDYYYDKAKRLSRIKNIFIFTPPTLLALSYIPPMQRLFKPVDNYRDIAIGILVFLGMLAAYWFDKQIQENVAISNALREEYDENVLGVPSHPFSPKPKPHPRKMKHLPEKGHYEVWYSEIFAPTSSHHYHNVVCCQLDNLIYAQHTYKKTKNLFLLAFYSLVTVTAVISLVSVLTKEGVAALLFAFSMAEILDSLWTKATKSRQGEILCDTAIKQVEAWPSDKINADTVSQLQEAVIKNRELGIFLPGFIREQYLQEDNSFYRALNAFKEEFMGSAATLPETDADIEVLSQNGNLITPLAKVHERLADMMNKITAVLDREGIPYLLDGGTLIGALRTNSFIPWDDDVDIALHIQDVARAKVVLKQSLDYDLQDATNDEFYSPRLANFRIRDRHSIVCEKDSRLYPKYKYRGIFVDVYAYSPIFFGSKAADRLYRRLFLHPLNRRLKQVEASWTDGSKTVEKRFLTLKKRYMRRLEFYHQHTSTKKSDVLAYSPEYIHDLHKAGPYLPKGYLFGDEIARTQWEAMLCRIPSKPGYVLPRYYGPNWILPPFSTASELRKLYGKDWYSKAPIGITALKHLSHIEMF